MTSNPFLSTPRSRNRGITLIEILIVIGVLTLFLSFAIPSMGTASSRAELRAAVENVSHSLAAARNIARSGESGITVNIPVASEGAQMISLTAADGKPNRLLDQLQPYNLSAEIIAISDQDEFVFDQRGLVENPGQILLVARSDDTVKSVITVN